MRQIGSGLQTAINSPMSRGVSRQYGGDGVVQLAQPTQYVIRPFVDELIQKRGMELDLDAAGLFKPDCREIYPAPWIMAEAVKRGIPFVYGSDTHSVKGVGQGFDEAKRILTSVGSAPRE